MVSSASGSAAVGSSDDIFAIQDEISAEVVDQLKLELLAGPPSAEQIDPVAYDLYLQGRHLTHTVQTTESYGEAVELLSRAVELAPNNVPAIWELARAITNVSFEDRPAEAGKKGRRIRALVDRMVELAPDSSYANGWLGAFAEEQGDLQAAALYRERALAGAVDSNLYLQQALAARFLAKPGRLDEAAALARYVIDRDPACATCVNSLSNVLRQAGLHRESAETLEELREWREFTPCMHWNLGVSWLFAGEPGRSLDHFEKTWPHMRDLGKLFALHDLGRIDEFEAEFSRLRQDPEASPEIIARIYAWTGQNDLAFEYLDYAVEKYGPTVAQSVRTDFYEPIKSDPRWQAFLKRYGVADEDLSHIRFNPKLPAEVVEALARK